MYSSIHNYDVDYTECEAYTYFDKNQEKTAHTNLAEFKTQLKNNRLKLLESPLEGKKCTDLWNEWKDKPERPEPPTCVCLADIDVTEDIKNTSYIYYKLGNFYQNHRRMLRSRDNNQLLALDVESVKNPDESCYVNKNRGDQAGLSKFTVINFVSYKVVTPLINMEPGKETRFSMRLFSKLNV